MSALRAVADYFVAPAADAADAPARRPAVRAQTAHVPAAVGVLCAPADARAIGCAAGLQLVGAGAAPAALVALWTGAEPRPGGAAAPPARAARRLAAAAAGRGLAARAAGRLTVIGLPADADAAVAAARQALATAAAVPTVLVVAGPREDALDDLLCACDVVLVAGDDALAGLAAELLERRGVATRRVAAPAVPAAAVAARGAALLPAARRALGPALGRGR